MVVIFPLDLLLSPTINAAFKCNYRAAMIALNVGWFGGSGLGDVAKFPMVCKRRHIPKRPTRASGAIPLTANLPPYRRS
jgi:hypothetical protein